MIKMVASFVRAYKFCGPTSFYLSEVVDLVSLIPCRSKR